MTIFLISPSKIMDSHKLKLVDFDSPEKKTEDSARLYQEQSSKSRTHESTNKAQVDGKVRSDGHRAPQHGANVTSTTTTPSASVKRFCLIKCRSDSASFSTTPNSKKHTINNTSSSEDLKNVTKKSSNYKKRFNLIFKKDSILNLHLKGGDYKRNKKHNKEIENQRYESKQETHNVTVTSKKSSKTQQMENNNKLPNDIFGFQKSNRSVDSCLYETSCNFLNVDANSAFKKLRKGFSKQHSNLKQQTPPLMESADKHHKVKVLNTDINSMQEKKVGNHNHSDDHVLSYKIRLSHEEVNKDTQRTNLNDNLTKDAKVLVSASSLAPIIKSCIDVACANNKSGVAPKKLRRRIIKHSDMQKSSSRSDVNESCFVKCKPYLVARANVTVKNETVINDTVVNVDEAKKKTIKSYVKRVCLGFIIIVWSPCLLVVIILAWILRKMKFLGEKNMKRISSMDSVNQKSLVDEREQKKGVQSLIQRFYDHVTGTATAVLSIFKLKRNKKQNNTKGDANNRGCLLDPHRDVYQTMNVLFKRDTQSSQDPNHQCAADDIFKIDQDKEIHKSAKKTSKKNLGFKPEDPLVYTCHYAERPKLKRVHSASVQVKPVHNRPRTNVATSPSGASVQFEITRKKPSRKSLFGWSSLRKPHSNKSPRDQKYACHAVHSSGSTKRSGLGFKKRSSPTAMHSRTTKCVCYPVRSTGCLKRSDPLTQSAQSETRSGPFAQSSGTTKCVCYSARSTRSKKCLDPLKQPAQSETCSSPRAQSSGTTKCVCYPVRSSRSIKRSEPAECKTRSGLIAQAARTIKGVCYPVRSTKSKKCAEPLAQPAKFETCSGPNTQAASTIKCVCHPVRSTRSKKRSKAFAQPAEFKTCYGPIAQAASTTKCVYYPVRSTRSKKRSAAFAQPAKCETRSDLIAQAARTIKCVFYPVRSTKSKKCSDPYAQPAEFKTCASPIAQAASITKCVCYPLFKKQTCRAVPLGSCGSKHFPCTGTGAPEPPTKVHECQCPNDGIVELKDDAGQPCPPLPDQSSCVCHAVPCPPKKKKKGSPLQQRCTCPKPISHSQCPPAGICCTCRKSRPRKCDPPEVCCTCRTPKKKKKYYTKGAKQAKCPCQNPGQSAYNNVSGYTKDKGTGNVNVNQNPHERGDFDMALCAGRKKPCRLFLPTCLARASCNEKLQTCPNKRKCINKNCKSKRRRRKCCKRKKKKKKFKCSWTAIKYCWEDICEFEREALYDIPELAVCAGANISHSERCRRACYKVRKVCRAFGRCWKAMFLAIGYFCIFCLASPVMGCLYLFYACCNIIICCKFI